VEYPDGDIEESYFDLRCYTSCYTS